MKLGRSLSGSFVERLLTDYKVNLHKLTMMCTTIMPGLEGFIHTGSRCQLHYMPKLTITPMEHTLSATWCNGRLWPGHLYVYHSDAQASTGSAFEDRTVTTTTTNTTSTVTTAESRERVEQESRIAVEELAAQRHQNLVARAAGYLLPPDSWADLHPTQLSAYATLDWDVTQSWRTQDVPVCYNRQLRELKGARFETDVGPDGALRFTKRSAAQYLGFTTTQQWTACAQRLVSQKTASTKDDPNARVKRARAELKAATEEAATLAGTTTSPSCPRHVIQPPSAVAEPIDCDRVFEALAPAAAAPAPAAEAPTAKTETKAKTKAHAASKHTGMEADMGPSAATFKEIQQALTDADRIRTAQNEETARLKMNNPNANAYKNRLPLNPKQKHVSARAAPPRHVPRLATIVASS